MVEFLGDHLAEVIAACALFLTVYQAALTRYHNRLSVRPHLTTFVSTVREDQAAGRLLIKAVLSNAGLGPAIIQSYQPILNGEVFSPTQPRELFEPAQRLFGASLIPHETHFMVLRKGAVLAKEASIEIAHIALDVGVPLDMPALENMLKRLHLFVRYECAYGKSFTYDSRKHHDPA